MTNDIETFCGFSDLQIDLHELVRCIAGALDARDENTSLHSERVSNMVQIVCRILGTGRSDGEKIHIAAHLHDIGKIGIPDRILLKEDKLNDEEWAVLKKHPDIGADMLSPVSGFKEISLFIRHHHERYDGLGYPVGLKGKGVPFGSRIIAVCDSIDAMLSERSYRKALSNEYCFSEIQNNIGIMYDPDIGNIVLSHWEEVLAARGG